MLVCHLCIFFGEVSIKVLLFFFYFLFFFCCTGQHVGSQFPNQGLNPRPLQWKHRDLTTALPGKSHVLLFLSFKISLSILDNSPSSEEFFCKYFSPSLCHSPLQSRNFNINEVQLINYFFHGSCIVSKTTSPYSRLSVISPMLSSTSFLILHFIFRYIQDL